MVSKSYSLKFTAFKRLKGCPTDLLIFGSYLVVCGKHSSILVTNRKLEGGSVIGVGCSIISLCGGNECLYFGTSKGKVYVCSEEQFVNRINDILEERDIYDRGEGEDLDNGCDLNDNNAKTDDNITNDITDNNIKDVYISNDTIKRYSNSLFMHFRSLKMGSCSVNSMTYCSKENGVVVGLANKKICLLKGAVALVNTFYGPKCPISYVCASKGGLIMVIGTSDFKFFIFKKEKCLSFKSNQGFLQCGGFYDEERFLVGTDSGCLLYFNISKSKPFFYKEIGSSITSLFLSKQKKSVLGTQNGFIYFFKLTSTDITILMSAEVYGVVNFIKYFKKSYYVGCGKENRVGRWDVDKQYMNCIVRIKVKDKEKEE